MKEKKWQDTVYTFYTDSNYVLISSRHFDIKVGSDGKTGSRRSWNTDTFIPKKAINTVT